MTPNSSKAIFLQLADRIMDEVAEGAVAPGARILSVRDYAAAHEVNANTVMRTYDRLQQLGVIFNRRGVGFFIADDAPERVASLRRENFFADEMPYFMLRLRQLRVSPAELGALYEAYLDKHPFNTPLSQDI